MIEQCNILRYSIFLGEVEKDRYYLFSCFDYAGEDFEADMAKMAADPTIQQWWKHTHPLEVPLPTRKEGQWWHIMEEVWRLD